MVAHNLGRFPEFSPTSHYKNVVFNALTVSYFRFYFLRVELCLHWVSPNCDMVELCFFILNSGFPARSARTDRVWLIHATSTTPSANSAYLHARISNKLELWYVYSIIINLGLMIIPFPVALNASTIKCGIFPNIVSFSKERHFASAMRNVRSKGLDKFLSLLNGQDLF